MKLLVATVLFVAFCAVAQSRPMWGPVGHAVTASIAQTMLTPAAQTAVSNILGNQSLSDVSDWADDIKHQPGWEWSAALHYINTPDWACNFQYSRDCVDDVCVAGAIFNYTKQLMTLTDPTAIQNALKFVTHFIGDIHQPLHAGFTSDEGGNDITGTFFGHNDNLHVIWDTWIIYDHMNNDFGGDQGQYTQYLISQVQGPWASNAAQWALCPSGSGVACPDIWGNESAGLACTNSYIYVNGTHIQDGFVLDSPYYNKNYPCVDMQLAKGGVRLATTLNNIFASTSSF